jgi:hypothetical protein
MRNAIPNATPYPKTSTFYRHRTYEPNESMLSVESAAFEDSVAFMSPPLRPNAELRFVFGLRSASRAETSMRSSWIGAAIASGHAPHFLQREPLPMRHAGTALSSAPLSDGFRLVW